MTNRFSCLVMDRSHIYPFKIINKDNWGMDANAHKVKSGNAILNLYYFFQSYRLIPYLLIFQILSILSLRV